ncbi:putative OsmC-like protein [Cerasibacillus quisquiliarum]|uniref:Peroxiredoxin n=1 Tax=Cerasibacillus quisquiliarum TaxID=227865 RepID=A0A511UTT1_9BACI|nr:OsmC family protein [Cerasibacillus quisquiliarum]MBB5145100.1 putative OsmC-like protein [Cerasibacillus quisquiliarum]GEN30010.1 peroxiredoxin [Cerasibacillus quisquiliarum]
MAKSLFHAKAYLQEGVQVKVQSRHFEVTIDEPKELGGTDTGMNPVELMLCALGACQSIVARMFAKKFEIEFEDFWVELTGELDTDGFLHKADDVRPGFQSIEYDIHIKTDASREKVEEFVSFIEKTCPVGDTIAHATKMELNDIVIE